MRVRAKAAESQLRKLKTDKELWLQERKRLTRERKEHKEQAEKVCRSCCIFERRRAPLPASGWYARGAVMLRRAAQVRLARVEMERALAEKDAQLHAALEGKVAAESQRASAEARLKILGRVIEEENERAEKAEAAGVSPRGAPALVFGKKCKAADGRPCSPRQWHQSPKQRRRSWSAPRRCASTPRPCFALRRGAGAGRRSLTDGRPAGVAGATARRSRRRDAGRRRSSRRRARTSRF